MILSSNLMERLTPDENGPSVVSVNLLNVARMVSTSVDLLEYGVYRHGERVAYIAYRIFKEMYPGGETLPIVLAGLLHDIGIDTEELKREVRNFILDDYIIDKHSREGEMLLDKVDLFSGIKPFVRHHHTRYKDIGRFANEAVPIEAQILCLADRIEVLIDQNQYILTQKEKIESKIKGFSGVMFNPEIVSTFLDLSNKESFWLDIDNQYMLDQLWSGGFDGYRTAVEGDIQQIAELCASIVDRKSSFTHIHSKRVATIARKLGEEFDMGQDDLFLLEMAGELHDIGKLSIPLSILHKTGKLAPEEYGIIRQHTYYTYYLIDRLDMMDKVRDWAAFHHERLDGSGYPFHLKGNELDLGSRILALADITTALSEDRPYRKGFSKGEIMDILWEQVREDKVDGDVVRALEKNFDYIVLNKN